MKGHGYTIDFANSDEFNVVPGSGWVILDNNGKRLDWPMLASFAEAITDLVGFERADHELAADEASEHLGLARMNGEF